jgi:pyrroloquinoline quinone biosynthesis protein B
VLRLLVLGSAAGGGFPQWNSNDAASKRARAGDPAALPRTQSSIAVTADDRHWVVCNASPDLRQQINENKQLHPRDGVRHSPISGVVLTNGDVDHVAGLLTLRESQRFSLYATERVLGILAANSIFSVLNPVYVDRRPMKLGEPFEIHGLVIEAFAVPGKVALYLEDSASPDLGTRAEDTVGLRIGERDGSSHLFYVPGCAQIPAELRARLKGAPLVLFDGTLWRDDEMIVAGAGSKTGRRMGHISVSGPDGSMAAFDGLDVGRKIFVHMNNTNPILLGDSPERAAIEAAGWEAAHDGLEIIL